MARHIGTLVFTGSTKGYNRIAQLGRLNITSTVEQTGLFLLKQHSTFNFVELCEAIEMELLKLADTHNVVLSISRQQIKSVVNRLAVFEQFNHENYKMSH